MTVDNAIADYVGSYEVGGKREFFPFQRGEVERAVPAIERVIASFALPHGRYVLTLSLTHEVAQFAPFERTLRAAGLIGTNADASPFDAPRVESIVRQFKIVAVCGLDAAMFQALRDLGHQPEKVLAGKLVWARPDAYESLRQSAAIKVRRMIALGPVLALECQAGAGLHVDATNWLVQTRAGRIIVSSRLGRFTPIEGLDTDAEGDVVTAPCYCGNPDPRVVI